MKPYLLTVWLVASAIFIAGSISYITNFTDSFSVVGLEVPQKINEKPVLGIHKTNISPVFGNLAPPILSAKAVYVEDLGTGVILYQKDASLRLPIASTTKIMTALVASEYYKQNSILKVEQNIAGSSANFVPGEDLTFRSVLYGMLLNSGNDAAFALADNYQGGLLGFVSAMNKKAAVLGLNNTHFDNPAGFDSPNHFSTAYDLAKMAKQAIKNETLARIFATKNTQVASIDQKYHHNLVNLNVLLSRVPGVLGIKTGYTETAKENFVGLVDRNGHKILTVVLGSDDRFGETTKLIEWSYANFTWPANIGQ